MERKQCDCTGYASGTHLERENGLCVSRYGDSPHLWQQIPSLLCPACVKAKGITDS